MAALVAATTPKKLTSMTVAHLVHRDLLDGADETPSGVVDQDVEGAVVGHHGVDAADRGAVDHVQPADVERHPGLLGGPQRRPCRVAQGGDGGEAVPGGGDGDDSPMPEDVPVMRATGDMVGDLSVGCPQPREGARR